MGRFHIKIDDAAFPGGEEAAGRLDVFAASLDAAEEELERNGPVPRERLAAMMAELEREWSDDGQR